MAKKLKRFVKGSAEAKRYMSRLRSMKKGGTTKKRKLTYKNGLYTTKKHRSALRSTLSKLGWI